MYLFCQNSKDALAAVEHQLAELVAGTTDHVAGDVEHFRREIDDRRQKIGAIDASVKATSVRLADVESRTEKVDQFVDEIVSSLTTSLAVDSFGRSQVTSDDLKVRNF